MTGKEVRALTDEEIGIELTRVRARVYQLRTQSVSEKVEDNSEFGQVRRDVARLLTERRSRELGARRTVGAGSNA